MIEIEFETEGWYDALIYHLLIPGLCLIGFALALKYGLVLAQMFHVSGKANEWVIVINSAGEMRKCGVGLNTFRMPYDQVAKFPSKINKVEFQTQQVD